MKKVKQLLPSDISLSITVLPCHLRNSEFTNLAKMVDYYVVQVHGIEAPKHIDDDCRLMRITTALSAIKRAEEIGTEFKVALPTYGYRLFFQQKSGKFIRLSAENSVILPAGTHEKVVCADLEELTEVIQRLDKAGENYAGIIWFRLPVAGDRLCLSRQAVAQLSQEIVPDATIKVVTEVTEDGALQVYLENSANMTCRKVTLTLHSKGSHGDYGLGRGFKTSEGAMPGILPKKIFGTPPAPGQRCNVGWFRGEDIKDLEIRCIEK